MKLMPEKAWIKQINTLKSRKTANKAILKQILVNTIKSQIPKKRFGILFSGGIDSSLIALICKQNNADFVCYSVGLENAQDIEFAQKVAKKLKLKLKFKIFSLKQAEKIIKKVTKIVGPDTMKVGVGSVIYSAAELAKKDKINILFSGLGSEEIFAGYERHVSAKDNENQRFSEPSGDGINKECWKGLKQMWKRDLKRDYAIANKLKITLLTPFLDKNLIKTAMQIPGKQKISKGYKKVILRQIAEELKLPKEFAWRKKQAAQYGSKFDKAIYKLARKNKFKFKKDYLESIFS